MQLPIIDPNKPFQPEFQPIVNDLIAFLRGGIGTNLHSIYIYGSVANKCAVKGRSNIDVIIVTHSDTIQNQTTTFNSIKWRFKQNFPYLRDVSIQTASVSEVTQLDNIFSWGFILRHLGVCVYGENLGECFGNFETNWEIAKNWNMDTEDWLEVYRQKIVQAENPSALRLAQVTIAKKLLRASYSLIMYRDKRWFDDPIKCGQVFLNYHADKNVEIERLLILLSGRPVPKRSVIGLIDGYGAWLVKAYKKTEFKIG